MVLLEVEVLSPYINLLYLAGDVDDGVRQIGSSDSHSG